MEDISIEFVKKIIKQRPDDIHKGDCGRVLIIAGAGGMAGAAVLSAEAALRTGSGLVYVCTSKDNFHVLQTSVPEAICIDMEQMKADLLIDCQGGQRSCGSQPENGAPTTGSNHPALVYDAVGFGPGMGTSEACADMLCRIFQCFKGPLVIDADGLNLIAKMKLANRIKACKARVTLTPHEGEAQRLLGNDSWRNCADRKEAAEAMAEKYGCNVVLKGAGTLVARRSEDSGVRSAGGAQARYEIFRNTTGNPGMATAGSGDVLAGVITSLAGQGSGDFDAAKAGVFIHGYAGDIAAAKMGRYGMIAGDIVRSLPYAIRSIQSGG